MPNQVLYGEHSFAEIGKQAKVLGKKVLIISDPIMENIGNVSLCEMYLKSEAVPYEKYLGVDSEPTDIHVDEAIAICRETNCEVIVAVGGGMGIALSAMGEKYMEAAIQYNIPSEVMHRVIAMASDGMDTDPCRNWINS